MKKLSILAVSVFMVLAVNSYAAPLGAQFSVSEANDPLVLGFSGLAGSLSFDLFLDTTPQPQGVAWDVYYSFADPAPQGGIYTQLQHIPFNSDSLNWSNQTLTNAVLTGNVFLRFEIDDFGNISNPEAFLKNFSSPATYISGGAQVPEPATMLLLGVGLIGLAGYGRKKLFR